jgi:hypothetical protein
MWQYGLFNDALGVSQTTKRRMLGWLAYDELESIWKEGVLAESRCYPGTHLERLREALKKSLSPPEFEPSISRVQVQTNDSQNVVRVPVVLRSGPPDGP